jgi:phosphatidylglycerophosphate synthase
VVAVILARELLVTALRAQIEATGGNFQAGAWGKWKMILQCLAIGGAILHGAGVAFVRCPLAHFSFSGPDALPGEWTLARATSAVAGVVTVLSGVDYVRRALAMLRRAPRA